LVISCEAGAAEDASVGEVLGFLSSDEAAESAKTSTGAAAAATAADLAAGADDLKKDDSSVCFPPLIRRIRRTSVLRVKMVGWEAFSTHCKSTVLEPVNLLPPQPEIGVRFPLLAPLRLATLHVGLR
jgi:hypothetical protein